MKTTREYIDMFRYDGSELFQLIYHLLLNIQIKVVDVEYPKGKVYRTDNNIVIEYSPAGLTDEEVFFVIAHEACHVLFGHLFINGKNLNHTLLNIAVDATINPYILTDEIRKKFTFVKEMKPEKWISGFRNLDDKQTWQTIYDYIINHEDEFKDKIASMGEEESDEDSDGEEGEGEGEGKQSESECSGGKGKDKKDGVGDGAGDSDGEEDKDGKPKKPKGKSKGKGKDKGDEKVKVNVHDFDKSTMPMISEKITAEMIKKAVEEADMDVTAGTELGNIIKENIPVSFTKRASWRQLLNKEVDSFGSVKDHEATYMKTNRRFSNNVYRVAASRELYYPKIGIVLDTSGSVSNFVLTIIDHVASIFSVGGEVETLIMGDTDVRAVHKNLKKEDIRKLKLVGFGGTKMEPLLRKALHWEHHILILITDMELPSSDFKYLKTFKRKQNLLICDISGNDDYDKAEFPRNIKFVRITEGVVR